MIRKRDLLRRLADIERALGEIQRSLDKVEVATIVREPSSQLAMEAYDGLRKQVVAAASERSAHLLQIATFAEAGKGYPDLAGLVRDWMGQADLVRVDEFDDQYFDVLAGSGGEIRILRPAYMDRKTGRPVVMGYAERVDATNAGEITADGVQDDQQEVAR